MMLKNLIDALLGLRRVTVHEDERVIVVAKGRLVTILGPGEHVLKARGRTLELERHALRDELLKTRYEQALVANRPDLVEAHFVELHAHRGEIVTLHRSGVLAGAFNTALRRALFWKDAAEWTVQRWPLDERGAVPEALKADILATGWTKLVHRATVAPGHVGLLTIGGVFQGVLGEGTHLHWETGPQIVVRQVDTRRRLHEVNGQEVLTADRVTIRVNIAVDVKVVDPVKAVTAVADFDEALHRALQLAFRRTLGARTLDRLLAEKVAVDTEAEDRIRAEMAEIGLEVGDIALKDIVLPGEMRTILNQVVQAEKAAEANIIRRREETAATRALLNTAKVMADNPVMLRLKELEALTELAGRVERLTIHNGTDGLMNDLVKLRE